MVDEHFKRYIVVVGIECAPCDGSGRIEIGNVVCASCLGLGKVEPKEREEEPRGRPNDEHRLSASQLGVGQG